MPPEFRQRIAEHNRSCLFGALLSFLGALLAWFLLGSLYFGAVQLFDVIRTGETSYRSPPFWFLPGGLGLFLLILLWAGWDRWRKRYRPPSDRMIIGWHLLPEVLLLPARTTFGIFDYLMAQVWLSRQEMEEAWRLLLEIHAMQRAETTRLAQEFPDTRELQKLLISLQLTDWIDLHRGEDDWFYKITSNNESLLRALTRQPEPESEETAEGEEES